MAERAPSLVLYVREGCHLCDRFLVELGIELGGRLDRLQVLDVDADPALAARYGLRVPLLEVDSRVAGEGTFDRDRFLDVYAL